jgi:hypothetical protein
LNHSAQQFDADKSHSFWTGFLFVSIEQRERTASKSKLVNDQILNDYMNRNWIDCQILLIDSSQWSQKISISSHNRFLREFRIIEKNLKSISVWIQIHLNGSLIDWINHSRIRCKCEF